MLLAKITIGVIAITYLFDCFMELYIRNSKTTNIPLTSKKYKWYVWIMRVLAIAVIILVALCAIWYTFKN